mmetsp:Transcript_29128/g.83621  ORF Transcript_29128/g.83621 Transcript_29128/m.83621 type:complete len:218 (+) Transcript_29128:64-717(+)|eukprot:CAMPEP_0176065522 /NCGR_PEP_ID=MMETSP0120_2-20121206/32691_1 /TAXON_ID=160619 /ORGANISM="Kryptoperidinium foliaceum, Strain CCMP 1326" /LENGTH=217 /DNA_ID=CAMNT_0017399115 /DNA_START=64 /DNA_END=717 /DNA_ORIENTATION=+
MVAAARAALLAVFVSLAIRLAEAARDMPKLVENSADGDGIPQVVVAEERFQSGARHSLLQRPGPMSRRGRGGADTKATQPVIGKPTPGILPKREPELDSSMEEEQVVSRRRLGNCLVCRVSYTGQLWLFYFRKKHPSASSEFLMSYNPMLGSWRRCKPLVVGQVCPQGSELMAESVRTTTDACLKGSRWYVRRHAPIGSPWHHIEDDGNGDVSALGL